MIHFFYFVFDLKDLIISFIRSNKSMRLSSEVLFFLLACMSVSLMYIMSTEDGRGLEDFGSPGTEITEYCELAWKYWELNVCLLKRS